VLRRGPIVGLILLAVAGALAYLGRTPHDRYALTLRLLHPDAAPGWDASAEAALRDPHPATLPIAERLMLDARAVGYAFHSPRGQEYVANVRSGGRVFVDLFRRTGAGLSRVASAAADGAPLDVEIPADGDYVVRIQPALDVAGEVTIEQTIGPSFGMPVEGARRSSIQSGFGAARDAGARRHEGVDIFAARGTPVVAAADGIVTSVGMNGLGGKVVWVVRPLRGESLYYAHLDTQIVKAGSYVKRGAVLGTVGNTGNARGGPAHLHFGIYARGGAVDPLPYLASVVQPPEHALVNHRRAASR
jgi:murein DD-endopeptidase MepM/ murein hydrolase activator NlpD